MQINLHLDTWSREPSSAERLETTASGLYQVTARALSPASVFPSQLPRSSYSVFGSSPTRGSRLRNTPPEPRNLAQRGVPQPGQSLALENNDRTRALPIPEFIHREEKRRGCFINSFDVTGWGPWDPVSSTPLPWPGEGALEVETDTPPPPSGIVLRSWLLAVEPRPFRGSARARRDQER